MDRLRLEDIQRAAEVIRPYLLETPCPYSETLSGITGAQVVLKYENHQFTASFKERGALVKLLSLDQEERGRGVIAMSAGNHAQAVAYHARRLGIPATIVMPANTPYVKVRHTRDFSAEVILHGATLEEAGQLVQQLVAERDLVLVHPYDDPQVISGQGTIALEMLREHPELEVLLVPVGGGGLIAGIAVAARAIKPEIRIIGVQTDRYPAMAQMLSGEPVVCGDSTLAEGIAVKQPGALTFALIRELVDEVLLVDEARIEQAVLLLLEVEKTLVEGAGAVGLAALLAHGERFRKRNIGLILSGGNIDPMTLSYIIQRGLVRSGRLVRLVVEMADRPGALAGISGLLGELQVNIVELRHQRTFSSRPLQTVEVELVLQTRGGEHPRELLAALDKQGYRVTRHDE